MMPTQTYICRNPAVDPVDDLRNCCLAIAAAGWWDRLERPERWPLSLADAAEMLRVSGQFDVDAGGLEALIECDIIQHPGSDEAGQLEFDAADIIEISRRLECRRQWLPAPCFHDVKKHLHQLMFEKCKAENELGAAIDGPFDLRQLYVAMVEMDSREGREKLGAVLQAFLAYHHGVEL